MSSKYIPNSKDTVDNKDTVKTKEIKKEKAFVLLPSVRVLTPIKVTLKAIRLGKMSNWNYNDTFIIDSGMICSDRFQARHGMVDSPNCDKDFLGFSVKKCKSIKKEYPIFHFLAKKWKAKIKGNVVTGDTKFHAQWLFKLFRFQHCEKMCDVLYLTHLLIKESKLYVFEAFILAHYGAWKFADASANYGNGKSYNSSVEPDKQLMSLYIPGYSSGKYAFSDFAKWVPFVMTITDHLAHLNDLKQINYSFLYDTDRRFQMKFSKNDTIISKGFYPENSHGTAYSKPSVVHISRLMRAGKFIEASKHLKKMKYKPVV